MNSNVLINVATEYDGKGFKQADSSLKILTKSVAKFTSGLALAHKAQQAMFDAMADEQASKVLAQNLRNLGMAFATIPAEQFIASMQRQTGVLDDELRPAYAQLARVTGDMYKTQELLMVAWNTSSGSGESFTRVIDALSQAYVGNTKGLKGLNLGLTNSELQAKSFSDIVTILNSQFGGAGAASLDTYAGKLAILQAAGSDASETIGMGLLQSMQTLSGSTEITDLAEKINNLAENFNRLTFFATTGARALMIIGGAAQNPKKAIEDWRKLLKDVNEQQRIWAQRNMKVWYPEGYMTPEMRKAADEAKKRAAQLLATNKKISAEKKAQALIDKANAKIGQAENIFNLERIGVAAAMQNQTLTENEQKRLEIKQAIFNLEDAIASKDTAKITSATNLLNGLLSQFNVMQKQDSLLGQIKVALDSLGVNTDLINLSNLQNALDLLKQMKAVSVTVATPTSGAVITGGGGGIVVGSTFDPASFRWTDEGNVGNMPTLPSGIGSTWDPGSFRASENTSTPVVINITDNAQKLVDLVTFATQNSSANGTPVTLNRTTQNLAW